MAMTSIRDQVVTGGVDHHGGVDALEGAPLGEEHLAAAALLGRRAEHDHPAAELVGERGRGEPGAEPGGADDVVPAGVADLREGVVLAEHRDGRAVGAGPGDEGGVEAEGASARPRARRPRGCRVSRSWAWCSSKLSSGCSQMSWDASTSTAQRAGRSRRRAVASPRQARRHARTLGAARRECHCPAAPSGRFVPTRSSTATGRRRATDSRYTSSFAAGPEAVDSGTGPLLRSAGRTDDVEQPAGGRDGTGVAGRVAQDDFGPRRGCADGTPTIRPSRTMPSTSTVAAGPSTTDATASGAGRRAAVTRMPAASPAARRTERGRALGERDDVPDERRPRTGDGPLARSRGGRLGRRAAGTPPRRGSEAPRRMAAGVRLGHRHRRPDRTRTPRRTSTASNVPSRASAR